MANFLQIKDDTQKVVLAIAVSCIDSVEIVPESKGLVRITYHSGGACMEATMESDIGQILEEISL